MFDPQIDIKTSYGRTDEFIQHFARKSMTDLNFTFLQQLYHHAISHPETKFVVTPGMQMGLAIPDDMSAYFYAQVKFTEPIVITCVDFLNNGIGGPNS